MDARLVADRSRDRRQRVVAHERVDAHAEQGRDSAEASQRRVAVAAPLAQLDAGQHDHCDER